MSLSVDVSSENPNKRPRLDRCGDTIDEGESVDQVCLVTTTSVTSKFEKFFKLEIVNDKKKGICLVCEKSRIKKIISRKDSSTTGMKRHLLTAHPKAYEEIYGTSTSTQKSLSTAQKKLTDMFSEQKKMSLKDSEALIVEWMAKKKLALSFFDDQDTQNFFHYLNPNIEMPRRNAARRMVMEQFEIKQARLKEILKNNCSKFSFTVDGWTSMNLRSYYGITIHFIDQEWKLQSLALDFIPAQGNHSGKAIAKVFFKCIKDYALENKIQGITVDNVSSNTTFMKELSFLMENDGYSFDYTNQHFRCFAHILNLGVQDVMKMLNVQYIEQESSDTIDNIISRIENELDPEKIDDDGLADEEELVEINQNDFSPSTTISKLRITFIKIRRSEQLQLTLKKFCSASNIHYVKPILDVKTRWNSTHDMIEVGLNLKNGLNLLWLSSSKNQDLLNLKLNDEEWLLLQKINVFLKNFKIVSNAICGEKYVTLPIVVVAFNLLLSKIESIVLELDIKPNRSVVDETLLIAFQASRDKMLKHYRKTNWIYCSCLILDPRHKIETFLLTEWGKEMKNEAIQCFEEIYKKIYSNNIDFRDENRSVSTNISNELNEVIDINALYDNYLGSTKHWKAELQEYLSLKRACRNENILEWWKAHEKTFPTLSKMAKDLLSVMATSVPVERLFSSAGAVMTKTRTKLKDDVVQALLCLHSWSSCGLKDKIKGING